MRSLKSLLILSLTAVLVSFFSSSYAAEEFSKQYKIEQLRNTAKMLKLASVLEVASAGLLFYLGAQLSEIGESGTTYYALGAVSVVGAFYTWNAASSNEREADRMERELLGKTQGMLRLGNGMLALKAPRSEVCRSRGGQEMRISLMKYSF